MAMLGNISGAFGMLGNAVGLGADFTSDDEKSGWLGFTAGGLGTIGSVLGIWDEHNNYKKARDSHEKRDARLGMAVNSLGALGGIADMVSGGLKASGNKKGSTIAGMFSSGIGILGGLAGAKKGIHNLQKADSGEKKGKAWNEIIGSAAGGISGILNMIAGGKELNEEKSGDSWAAAGSILGNGAGILSGILGFEESYLSGMLGGLFERRRQGASAPAAP